MDRWAIGVDLGGTNIRVAAVGDDGSVLARLARPVDPDADPTRPFGQLTAMIDAVMTRSPASPRPAGVGIGATGPVDGATGTIANPWTLPPNLQGDVRAALRSYGEVVLENDADVAAVAEHRWGAGRGRRLTACITVGTGVGVGVVDGAGVRRGAGGAHAEAGHHVVDPSGPRCYCGARGCVESLASARAVAAAGVEAGIVAPGADAAAVHRLAAEGHPQAAAIADRARRALRTAAHNLVATHAPDVVVFAGQAIGDPERLVAETAADLARFPFGPGVTVAASTLDDLAGCLGAAGLVLAP